MPSGDPSFDTARARLQRHAFALARELALSDEERRELAMMLPSRKGASEPVSWALLEADEYAHLVNWMDGARLILALYRLRA